MGYTARQLMLAVFLIASLSGCQGERASSPQEKNSRGPASAATGLDGAGQMRISESDRCPVCAMRPHKHPKFASAIELKDGRTFYFCGTGCMIRSYRHPEVFLGTSQAQITKAVARDYFSGDPIDALNAVWVAGSDVIGPMGPALVPLKSAAGAADFRKRHGGKHTFQLAELDDEKWFAITGKPAVPPQRSKSK